MSAYERHHIAGRAHSSLTLTVPKDVHHELTALQLAHGVPLIRGEYPNTVSAHALLLGTADILDLLADSAGVEREPSFAVLVSHLCTIPKDRRLRVDLGQDAGTLVLATNELLGLLHMVLVELVSLHD